MGTWHVRNSRRGSLEFTLTGGTVTFSLRSREARALGNALMNAAATEDEWLRRKREQDLQRFVDEVGTTAE